MNMMLKRVLWSLLLLVIMPLQAATLEESLPGYQEQWAHINYEVPRKQREAQFEALAGQLADLMKQYPDRPEPMIWHGIVLSTWAGAKGGLGALGLVKEARTDFEQSLVLSQDALNGSAYTSLGSLYYQVPGWPIGFGDDDKSREMLEKALQINPAGIDSNYFYADYWLEQGEYRKARDYFNKALQAPDRPQRPLADAGRREEIRARLEQIERKLKQEK